MSDEEDYFTALANAALDQCTVQGMELAQLRSRIMAVLKEAERDARHKACEAIYSCVNTVQNQRPGRR